MRDVMKGADPHPANWPLGQCFDTAAHFCGCFIRKRNRENAPRRRLAGVQVPRDAVDQHARFAAPGAGEYQHLGRGRRNRIALAFVECREDRVFGHAAFSGR